MSKSAADPKLEPYMNIEKMRFKQHYLTSLEKCGSTEHCPLVPWSTVYGSPPCGENSMYGL